MHNSAMQNATLLINHCEGISDILGWRAKPQAGAGTPGKRTPPPTPRAPKGRHVNAGTFRPSRAPKWVGETSPFAINIPPLTGAYKPTHIQLLTFPSSLPAWRWTSDVGRVPAFGVACPSLAWRARLWRGWTLSSLF